MSANWLILAAGGAVLGGLFLLWLCFAPGPRRARGYRRGQRLVREGKWQIAFRIVRDLQSKRKHNKFWHDRLRSLEGECLRTAGAQAVQAKDFETGLQHHLQAAEILNINPKEVRACLVEKMLTEVRAAFCEPSTAAAQSMLKRVFNIQSPCPESSFWQGLCLIRDGQLAAAKDALLSARGDEAPATSTKTGENAERPAGFIDPPLYLGGLLLRLSQPKEALRYLTEANRIDGNCPLVALQLGSAMVAAGTDGYLAMRALNRALGARSLQRWLSEPDKMWLEGFPENQSFIRKLAAKHRFLCPLWGNDLALLMRQGRLAYGQAQFRTEQYKAAVETFQKLFDEGVPTHDVLRCLGLALTRLNRYDEAFTHLKTALEMEQPQDRFTAGYLALCAARAKPDKPGNQGPNVAWAVKTVRRFEGFGDREWVSLLMQVFGEALKLNMALAGEDHQFLCDHLLSVQATDADAATAFHQLLVDHPALVKPPYAWLYCQAALTHHLEHERSLDLFALTFQTATDARTYFERQGWDFAGLEFAFLAQASAKAPGSFPAELGADYPQRGETLLLERSERKEKENDTVAAIASAEILLQLAPRSARAHDRLAMLWYRSGDVDRSIEFLRGWSTLEPNNPKPLARLAAVYHTQGLHDPFVDEMRAAIECSEGKTRADLACLAAKLLLANATASHTKEPRKIDATDRSEALGFLHQCLDQDPAHAEALWLTAAIHTVQGDRPGLAELSARMLDRESPDPRYHYFAAASHLAAGQHEKALEAANKAGEDQELKTEATYLAGWASIYCQNPDAALAAMRTVASAEESPSSDHAKAIVGAIRYHQGAAEDAIRYWQDLDGSTRTAWKIDSPLQKILLVAGMEAMVAGQFEQAAERFREASKAGFRDRALQSWIHFALVKAGQRLLYANGE